MKNIYILNSCNEWKENSSMGLVMASTSERKIISEIKKQIKEGNMEYKRGNDDMSKTAQCKMLSEDLKENGSKFVFDNIEYGYINIVSDGERQ